MKKLFFLFFITYSFSLFSIQAQSSHPDEDVFTLNQRIDSLEKRLSYLQLDTEIQMLGFEIDNDTNEISIEKTTFLFFIAHASKKQKKEMKEVTLRFCNIMQESIQNYSQNIRDLESLITKNADRYSYSVTEILSLRLRIFNCKSSLQSLERASIGFEELCNKN